MNKKLLITFLVFFVIVGTLSFVFSQSSLDNFGKEIESKVNQIERIEKDVKRMTKEDYKWEELSKRWREILLKNEIIAFLDDIFKKGNIVFIVLFGKDYSLSLILLFLIILWFYFWDQFYKIISTFSTFGNSTSLLISLGMTIILAQAQFFDLISQLLFKFIFYRQGVLGWLWYFISFGVILLFAIIFSRFFSSLKMVVLELKDKQHRQQILAELEGKNKYLGIFIRALKGAFVKEE